MDWRPDKTVLGGGCSELRKFEQGGYRLEVVGGGRL